MAHRAVWGIINPSQKLSKEKMAVINSEYIDANVDKILDLIENYPNSSTIDTPNRLYYIGHRTTNPIVLQAIYRKGVTQEMLDATKHWAKWG